MLHDCYLRPWKYSEACCAFVYSKFTRCICGCMYLCEPQGQRESWSMTPTLLFALGLRGKEERWCVFVCSPPPCFHGNDKSWCVCVWGGSGDSSQCVWSNDVYKSSTDDAMYWQLRGFEASRPYWHSPVGAVLHRDDWNSTVFQLNVSRTKWHYI
jgi:hypothetical protein